MNYSDIFLHLASRTTFAKTQNGFYLPIYPCLLLLDIHNEVKMAGEKRTIYGNESSVTCLRYTLKQQKILTAHHGGL